MTDQEQSTGAQPHSEPKASLAGEGYDGRSIAALVLGVAALAMSFSAGILGALLGFVAIVCGLLSRGQLRRHPGLRGSRLSLAGVILGAVAFALTAVPLLFPIVMALVFIA